MTCATNTVLFFYHLYENCKKLRSEKCASYTLSPLLSCQRNYMLFFNPKVLYLVCEIPLLGYTDPGGSTQVLQCRFCFPVYTCPFLMYSGKNFICVSHKFRP
jgi:hypothetical protein